MDKWLILIFIIAGVGLSSQAAINGGLGKSIGAIEATFVSFLVGTTTLFLIMLFMGKGHIGQVFSMPKWQLTGGLIGAAYIAVLTIAVPKIGVGVSIISVICGQLIMSMTIDHFGLFNSTKFPINTQKLIGAALLIIALFFLVRGNHSDSHSIDTSIEEVQRMAEAGAVTTKSGSD